MCTYTLLNRPKYRPNSHTLWSIGSLWGGLNDETKFSDEYKYLACTFPTEKLEDKRFDLPLMKQRSRDLMTSSHSTPCL